MPCDAEWVPAPGGWEEPVLYDNWYLPQDAPTHAERMHAEYMLAKQGWPPQMAAQMAAHAQQHTQHMQAMYSMPPQMAASVFCKPLESAFWGCIAPVDEVTPAETGDGEARRSL